MLAVTEADLSLRAFFFGSPKQPRENQLTALALDKEFVLTFRRQFSDLKAALPRKGQIPSISAKNRASVVVSDSSKASPHAFTRRRPGGDVHLPLCDVHRRPDRPARAAFVVRGRRQLFLMGPVTPIMTFS